MTKLTQICGVLASRWRRTRAPNEQGGALAFVLIIGVAMAFIAILGVVVSLSGRRAAAQSTLRRAAFFCAEAGLERARAQIAGQVSLTPYLDPLDPQYATLNPVINSQSCPSGMGTFTVTMRDNVDDGPPSVGTRDVDRTVILDSQCSLNGNPLARISALVTVVPGTNLVGDYKTQAGLGAMHTQSR